MKPVKFGTWKTDHCKHVNYHREQYKFGTWRTVQIRNKRTEQIWNKENSTNLEQREQIWNIKPVKFGKWNTDHCKHVNHLQKRHNKAVTTVKLNDATIGNIFIKDTLSLPRLSETLQPWNLHKLYSKRALQSHI